MAQRSVSHSALNEFLVLQTLITKVILENPITFPTNKTFHVMKIFLQNQLFYYIYFIV